MELGIDPLCQQDQQELFVHVQAGLQRLQAESEQFVAANWQHLKMDRRLTHELDADSLCRIHRMAGWMFLRPLRHSPGRVSDIKPDYIKWLIFACQPSSDEK